MRHDYCIKHYFLVNLKIKFVPHRRHCLLCVETIWLKQFKERTVIYSGNHITRVYHNEVKNVFSVIIVGTYSIHCALKGCWLRLYDR